MTKNSILLTSFATLGLLIFTSCADKELERQIEEAKVQLDDLKIEGIKLQDAKKKLADEKRELEKTVRELPKAETSAEDIQAEKAEADEYIAKLENAVAQLEDQAALWRERLKNYNIDRKLVQVVTKAENIYPDVIIKEIDDEKIKFISNEETVELPISSLSYETLTVLLHEETIADRAVADLK